MLPLNSAGRRARRSSVSSSSSALDASAKMRGILRRSFLINIVCDVELQIDVDPSVRLYVPVSCIDMYCNNNKHCQTLQTALPFARAEIPSLRRGKKGNQFTINAINPGNDK